MNAVQIISLALGLLSGVALFLYGMNVMGDGLKKVAGNKMETLLYRLTSNPIKGILLGAGVTAIIQSSSATSVMVVGFVNSGMMKVVQGIGIIMGANIGTSITGWILCLSDIEGADGIAALLSSATISAVIAIAGILIRSIAKKDSYRALGDIMLGFAVLMLGMATMKDAMVPLQGNEQFRGLLTKFSNPFLGILVGIIITAILQSASASVGILQSITASGYLPFSAALPIIMGIGIGAACPVLISGMSSNKNGKRTALVYLINDLFGMIICATLFYLAQEIVMKGGQFFFMDYRMNSVTVALMNTVYRVLTIVFLAPFINQIEKLVFWLIKDTEEDEEEQPEFDLLEERFLRNPDIALAQVHTVMNGMAKKSRKNVLRALKLMEEYSEDKYNKVQERETLIDKYEDKLGTYLMQVTARELNRDQIRQSSKYLHTVSDFERIADHACGISRVAKEIEQNRIHFSEEALHEIKVLKEAVMEIMEMTVVSFRENDLQLAKKVEPLRITIRMICGKIKKNHIIRLQTGNCEIDKGFAFNDLISNLERISAHCSNVAVAMIEFECDDFNTHEYLKEMRNNKDLQITKDYNYYQEKYCIESSDISKEKKSVSDGEKKPGNESDNEPDKSLKKEHKKEPKK